MMERIHRRDLLKLIPLIFLSRFGPILPERTASNGSGDLPQNVLLLVFDTLSAPHLSIYDYRRNTTPNLARFAERATVYHAHYASGNFTTPGTASILTGTYPWTHRGFHFRGTVLDEFFNRNIFSSFHENGYLCFGFSHNMLVNILMNQFREPIDYLGMSREFALADHNLADRLFSRDYRAAIRSEEAFLKHPGKSSNSLFMFLLAWLLRTLDVQGINREMEALFPRGVPQNHDIFYLLEDTFDWLLYKLMDLPQPYFAYIHLMPPHAPYNTRWDFIDIFKDGWDPIVKPDHVFSQGETKDYLKYQRRLYDEYIAYADAEFGRFYDLLAQKGLLDNTWVVCTSDHGEMFERGIWQHQTRTLFQPIVRVPLLISQPNQNERQDIYTLSSSVDLLPTLLHVTGQPVPEWCEGEILSPFENGSSGSSRNVYVVEAKSNPKSGPLKQASVAMMKEQYKLIHYLGYPGYDDFSELYDLLNDPDELNDLSESRNSLASDLSAELKEAIREVNDSAF
jgi:arylsulfatase A-like enzyme